MLLAGASGTATNVVLSDHEFFLLATGTLVPVVVYFFHRFVEPGIQRFWDARFPTDKDLADSLTETTKGVIQVTVAAAWGVIYAAAFTSVGLHLTVDLLKSAAQAAVAALFSHNILWKPAGVNVVINRPHREKVAQRRQQVTSAAPL